LDVPYYRSAYVLFYNQSWARELGYTGAPATPQDFRTQACGAADFVAGQDKQTDKGKGGWLITPQPGVLVGWIYAFGGQITNPDGSGYLFNTSQTRQALEYLKDLSDSNCAWSGAEVNPSDEFANRHALFVVGSLFDLPAQREAFKQAGNADTWVVIPFPSRGQPVVVAYGPSIMITRSTPAKQLAAWLVAEWLVYPPNQASWVETLETLPTRQNTLVYLDQAASDNAQWRQALELLPVARSEPSLVSWSIMRWALQDAMAELFDPQVKAEQIPALLKNLDDIATEVVQRVR
jgi:ABC-type glycerol-3-phosphate transport system substrate-binding protein